MTGRLASFALCALVAWTAAAEMSSADATVVLLNSRNAVSAETFAEAQAVVERDAEAGRPLQQFVIGVTTDDKELSERYLASSRERIRLMAAEKDNPLAWYLLSVEKNDMRLLEKAANGGNVQALNALGTILMRNAVLSQKSTNELAKVFKRSFDCFSLAVLQRDPNAYINLGSCYLRGYGCQQDRAMAFLCFKSAAEAGHPEGMENMSNCYKFGYGVNRDDERSLYWLMRARAVRGDKAAETWLKERK